MVWQRSAQLLSISSTTTFTSPVPQHSGPSLLVTTNPFVSARVTVALTACPCNCGTLSVALWHCNCGTVTVALWHCKCGTANLSLQAVSSISVYWGVLQILSSTLIMYLQQNSTLPTLNTGLTKEGQQIPKKWFVRGHIKRKTISFTGFVGLNRQIKVGVMMHIYHVLTDIKTFSMH